MPHISTTILQRFSKLGVHLPDILLPSSKIETSRWSVNACDQYTSDHEYWKRVEDFVGKSPSTLRLTLPEIFLETKDVDQRIASIHQAMKTYLSDGTFETHKQSLVFVRRDNVQTGRRAGLVLALDLEYYNFARDSKTLIRATEGTIVDRIPPRLKVREKASLELPHIMVLIDDPNHTLLESLDTKLSGRQEVYQVTLMESGGQLSGTLINDEATLEFIVTTLEALLHTAKVQQKTDSPLFFAMGDGNHSLATAKTHWENIKKQIGPNASENHLEKHPARYALVEIVNIHSPGLHFEPIHRAFFDASASTVMEALQAASVIIQRTEEKNLQTLLTSAEGQARAGYFDGKHFYELSFATDKVLPPAQVDSIFADTKKKEPTARIDFIHGWDDTKKLGTSSSALVFFLPVIARNRLFRWVQENGPLPRKAFSMGEADEKRYYMESRIITP